MATHQIYIGGPGRGDNSRHQFPNATFSASGAAFKAMVPAAHKGPTQYALTRTLDFGYTDGVANDPALQDWLANATVATGDVLNLVVIPANCLLYGVMINVEKAANTSNTLTLQLKVGSNFFGSTTDLTTAGSAFAPATTTATAAVTSGAIDLSTAVFDKAPTMLAGTLAMTAETDFKDLRLSISPLVSQCQQGQY